MTPRPPVPQPMVDIHCHMIAGIDDGSASRNESLAMARLAVQDGIGTVVVTPHQLGNFPRNSSDRIRRATAELQHALRAANIPLAVLPGADVRIDEHLIPRVRADEVLTLGDHRRHLLLELPHELYFPLTPMLEQLQRIGIVGILSHPERNRGLLAERTAVRELVGAGCLMQITAGSITGKMGGVCQDFSHWMLREGLVHFVATDAHGATSRRPLLRRAYDQVTQITDEAMARELCVQNPSLVAQGCDVAPGRRKVAKRDWFRWKKAPIGNG